PLIISGPVDDAAALYHQFARIVAALVRERDYEVDEAKKTVAPTEEGIGRVEELLGVANLYDNVNQNFVHQLQAALRAKELFKVDVDYLVDRGEVKIVDEFTGRVLEGRRWSEGLHQAVEAKEGVRIKEENQTLATITIQNYFRLYEKLGGMTGTASTEAGEFAHTYGLEVVSIPTHRSMVRADQPDLVYKTEDAKFAATVDDIAERHERGQPVLVGTVSVEKSERLSRLLDKRGIPHSVLNAKQHEREATIVAQAGRPFAVTVATNMAGRGVDIILGGNAESLARQELAREGFTPADAPERYAELFEQSKADCTPAGDKVREVGGLYVLGTERHESRRIDNQLRGRAGRQGDPGESRFYLSLGDDLMRLFAQGALNWVMDRAFPDDEPLEAKMVSKAIERAQRTVEDRNFEIRKDVLKYDEVMNEQRKVVYRRRQQVLDGEDLSEQTAAAIQAAIERSVDLHCSSEYPEEWDVDELWRYVRGYFPVSVEAGRLKEAIGQGEIVELLIADALAQYQAKEGLLGSESLREIERRVMLAVIDQRWREHLHDMDYLRDGIHLRAMGQKDPLVEWQREGFDMFQAMMGAIDDDFVRYVFHLEVVEKPAPEPEPARLSYSAPTEPVQGSAALEAAAASEGDDGEGPPGGDGAGELARLGGQQPSGAPMRAEQAPGRNQPCPCGSGKKYKFCHGR
ncbi:MAG: preprotein translocase subunit SecA, partial [Acidimicrobiia bacterium]